MSIETLSSAAEPLELKLPPPEKRSSTSIFLRNSASNVVRTAITAGVSILLPTFLTHRLPVKVYGAWVLILQLSAYVAYLNLGVQTAVAKYIAEYEARQDWEGCGKCASAGLRIMLVAGALGFSLTAVVAVYVPQLFREMPPDLLRDVRVSIVVVGASLSVGLASSIFSAIFMGLQRYEVPMAISIGSRLLYGAAVCAVVGLHRGLIVMAAVTAIINLLTSAAEVVAWRRLASAIHVSVRGIDLAMLREMLAYCSVLTVWSACMLFISGLDVTIVGHFDFSNVAFYSIGNAPTNLVLMVVGALLGPLLPVASALNISSSPEHMGVVLLRTTRYATIVLLATGLPVLVAGFPILRLWVGRSYALNSILFLHLLLLANMIRNLTSPLTTMAVAISRQRAATAPAICEAVVNLSCSILLARRFGAVGVAWGTLIGAITGLALHFAITLHYTRGNFTLSRLRLFLAGIVRPMAMAVPSLLLLGRWWVAGQPAIGLPLWGVWAGTTALTTWFVSLEAEDRGLLVRLIRTRAI